MNRSFVMVLVGALALARVPSALAQPAGAQAEALFDKGKKLMGEGKTAEACTAFESSQKLDPQVTTLMNLAACREKNGELASAWAWFIEVERTTRGKQGGEKKLNQTAKDRAGKLEGRLSKLTINVKREVVGLEVLRDGTPVERGGWNTALPVDGGSFSIVARAPGYREWTGMVTVADERDNKSIDVPKLEKAPAGGEVSGSGTKTGTGPESRATTDSKTGDDGSTDEDAVETQSPSKALPIALAVTGGVLAGGAIGFELWGRSKYNASKTEPDDAKQEALWKAANTRRYVAIGMGGAAVVSVGVSVLLFMRSPKQERQSEARRHIHVQPVASAQLTGLLVHGSF